MWAFSDKSAHIWSMDEWAVYTEYGAADVFLHHSEPSKTWEQKFDEKITGVSSSRSAPSTKYTMALRAYTT